MIRRYGWSTIGQRCIDHVPHNHWRTATIVGAIRSNPVIEGATVLLDGTLTRECFEDYVKRCLVPSLQPGEIVVMDNLLVHKGARVRELIEGAGCDLWYQPPHSPDLNPIEYLWSKVKNWLRCRSERRYDQLPFTLYEAMRRVTTAECENYFKACGYG